MSLTDDRVEILIGKLLDDELSPQERRLLDDELDHDGHARELLEQMRVLHECSCGVVTHEVLGRGADPEELFERAWQQNRRSLWRRVVTGGRGQGIAWGGSRADGHLRFAVGLAAGLVLGLVLHFVLAEFPRTPSNVRSGLPIAEGSPSDMGDRSKTLVTGPGPGRPDETTRLVDWYVFTDRTGNRWLVEGVREGMVRPAAYHGSL